MELAETIEIGGEEKEIADAYVREQVTEISGNLSTHTSNTSNPHEVTKSQVGLGNADNTSDMDKPISTKQQAEFDDINNNLDGLAYGENGAKNLFNPKCLLNATYDEKTDTITVSANTHKALDMVFKENTQYTFSAYIKQSGPYINIRLNIKYTDGTSKDTFLYTQSTSEEYLSETSQSGKTISEVRWYFGSGGTATFRNFQIEEGTTATPYKPYIPSVKMLAEENTQQNTEAMDLKMLGWSVPKECPVQNYVDSDGVFHQRVCREDLGCLNWKKAVYDNYYYFCATINGIIKRTSYPNENANILCNKYKTTSQSKWHLVDDSISYFYTSSSDTVSMILVHDESYTDSAVFKTAMQGVYLYYELAEEITTAVDGNEAVTKLNDDVSEIKKELSDSLPIGTILTVVDSATMSSDMWKLLKTGTLSYQDGGALVEISTITYQKIK